MNRSFHDHHSDIDCQQKLLNFLKKPIKPVAVGKIWLVGRVLLVLFVVISSFLELVNW
jgi:hypothetical protein